MRIRIGTRGSDLALWQAHHVQARLAAAGHEIEVVVLVTRGDRIDDVPLQQVEGKGFFTKELEDALLEERIDLAVHSHKDLPGAMTPGLVIAAVPARAAAAERLLVAPAAHAPAEPFLPVRRGARVGTSAPRREQQLLALRSDLELLSLRGNVPTRVRRLREGRYDAILLAAAGLDRLGLDLSDLVVITLPIETFVPAPGQGALGIQVRARDAALLRVCAEVLADPLAAATVAAERGLLQTLGGGCNLPLGVALERLERGWRAHAFLGAGHPRPEHGSRWCRAEAEDPAAAAARVGERLMAGHATGAGPLGGLRIALTGTRDSALALERHLVSLGASVTREEAVAVEDLAAGELADRVASLRRGDGLVVTSSNAARRLAGLRPAEGVCVAAVGAATARTLAAAGLVAQHVGNAGARELARGLTLGRGARVLFPCAEDARAELEEELGTRGVAVERLPLYRTRARSDVALDLQADVRLYLSPSAVSAVHEREGTVGARRLALGTSTSEALSAAGLAHGTCRGTSHEDVVAALLALTRVLRPLTPEP